MVYNLIGFNYKPLYVKIHGMYINLPPKKNAVLTNMHKYLFNHNIMLKPIIGKLCLLDTFPGDFVEVLV